MSQREGILYSLRVFNLRSKYYFALNYPNPSQFRSFYPNLGIFNPAPGRQTVTQHCAWRHSLANSCYQDTWGTNFARVRNPPQLSTLVLIPQRELKMHRILKSRPREMPGIVAIAGINWQSHHSKALSVLNGSEWRPCLIENGLLKVF